MQRICTESARRADAAARRIVGANVRNLRKARGWSQIDLGERIGAGQSAISAIECGTRCPSLPMLFRLALAYEVRAESLVRAPDGESAAAGDAP